MTNLEKTQKSFTKAKKVAIAAAPICAVLGAFVGIVLSCFVDIVLSCVAGGCSDGGGVAWILFPVGALTGLGVGLGLGALFCIPTLWFGFLHGISEVFKAARDN